MIGKIIIIGFLFSFLLFSYYILNWTWILPISILITAVIVFIKVVGKIAKKTQKEEGSGGYFDIWET